MNPAQSTLPASLFESVSAARIPLELLALCLCVSLLGLLLAKLLRLDSIAERLLLRRIPRSQLISKLEELAASSKQNDPRAIRRIADRCDWQLLRIGAEMIARGAEPPEIAHELERKADFIFRRRVSTLRRIAGFTGGVLLFPVGVVVLYAAGALGDWNGAEAIIAGCAFAGAIGLLVVNSTAKWMCDHADSNRAAHALDAEALIFALSAIRGGAEPADVREMMQLVLGQNTARTPLKQAA